MDRRKPFLLSIAALALAGCTSTGGDVASKNFGVFAQSCQAGANKCVVTISVAAGKTCVEQPANITITPETLVMDRRNGPIVWTFAQSDYAFCPSRGDGVYIQSMGNPTSQFINWGATDKENGDEETQVKDKCYKRFRMYNFNSDALEYYYVVRFSDMRIADPKVSACAKDPWVRNG